MSTSSVKKFVAATAAILAVTGAAVSAQAPASADSHLRAVTGTIAGTVTATDVSNFPVTFSADFDFTATLDGLGTFQGSGPAVFLPSFDPVTGCRNAGTLDFEWVAENGDTLNTVILIDDDNPFASCVIPDPAGGPPLLATSGSFLITGGTGVFAGIAESVIKFELTNPAGPVVPFSGTLDGEIDSSTPYVVVDILNSGALTRVVVENVSGGVSYANVVNDDIGRKIVLVMVNGQLGGVVWVEGGATASLDISRWMDAGNDNAVAISVVAEPGSVTRVLLTPEAIE